MVLFIFYYFFVLFFSVFFVYCLFFVVVYFIAATICYCEYREGQFVFVYIIPFVNHCFVQ